MNKDILAFLAKTLNQPEDAVASLLNDDGSVKDNAISTLNEWDSKRIKTLKEKDQLTFDNGYKKAQKEVATKFEKSLKEELGIDTDSTGDELVTEIKTAFESKAPAGKALTEDEIKKHPVFIATEKKFKADLKAATEASELKINEFTAEQTRKERLALVWDKAQQVIMSKKPILPQDPAKAKLRLTRDVLEPLKGYDFEINGEEIVILKDGKRLEDEHGYPVKFDAHVLKIGGESLDFSELEDKRSPITGQPPPAGKAQPAFVPKNQEEFQAYLKREDVTPIEKRDVIKAWDSKQRQ